MPAYRFLEDPATRQVSCFIHLADPSELNAFRLRQAWEASEFTGCFMFADRVEPAITDAMNALAAAARSDAPASSGAEGEDGPLLASFVIGERRDASCTVAVSDDLMNAEASAVTACGGAPLDRAMIDAGIEAADVRFGIDDVAIADLLAAALEASAGSLVRRMIARGERPGPGTPSRFENLVVPWQDRVLRPQEREDGSVDLRDLGAIETVAPGDVLVRRHPALPGPPGSDVHGNSIAAEVPAEMPFTVGEGSEIDTADEHLLRASRSGVPHRATNGMSVNDLLVVDEVDLHTGHVEFDGSLLVKGDVRTDMRVRVTKDVIVNGFIESALVEAAGDVTARLGVIGPPAEGSHHNCHIKGRNITTKYAQNATLEAAEDITLQSHLLHSQVLSCRNLVVGGERNRSARLVGGLIRASRSVTAGVFGAEAGTPTRIVMDDELQRLRLEIEARHGKRTQLTDTSARLEQSLKELAQKPRTEALTEKLTRIANTIKAYRDELKELDEADETGRRTITALTASLQVTALQRIHAGLELQCLDVRHRFGSERGPGTLGVRDGSWTSVES